MRPVWLWRFTERKPRARSIATIIDRKSTRLNSSHSQISYAVFCLKKKNSATTLSTIISEQPLALVEGAVLAAMLISFACSTFVANVLESVNRDAVQAFLAVVRTSC